FVVVHLYGSHPISCDRLTDYPKMFDDEKIGKKYFNGNCYASSIKKTDEVLKRLYETLRKNEQQSNRSFSVVYFADHGLAHHITENDIAIHNSSGKSKLHFDVPLFKISSDDTDRKVYKAMKSGLNFTDGIAKWVGISNPKLNTEVDLFSPHSDKEDYGLKKLIDGFEGKVDPAVVIPKDE
ncbi:sulfatase-like hydrolase/transferase, partial [Glaesserella parasuis]